jgi:hypothetical protein
MKCAKNGADDHGLGSGQREEQMIMDMGSGERESYSEQYSHLYRNHGDKEHSFFKHFLVNFCFRWPVKPSNRTLLFFSPEASGKFNDLLRNVFYRYKSHRDWPRVTIRIKSLHFRIWKLRNGISNGVNGISNEANGISTAALFSLLVIQHQKIPRTS